MNNPYVFLLLLQLSLIQYRALVRLTWIPILGIKPVWLGVSLSVRYFISFGKNVASSIFCKGLHTKIGRICFRSGMSGNTLFKGTSLDVNEHFIPGIS